MVRAQGSLAGRMPVLAANATVLIGTGDSATDCAPAAFASSPRLDLLCLGLGLFFMSVISYSRNGAMAYFFLYPPGHPLKVRLLMCVSKKEQSNRSGNTHVLKG